MVLILVLGASLVAGAIWYGVTHTYFEGTFYPKDTPMLDFRQEEVSLDRYKAMRKAFPNAEILWNVPFQGATHPHDIQTLAVTVLAAEDLPVLAYFENLTEVDARDCTEYTLLEALRQQYPALTVQYTIPLGGRQHDWSSEALVATKLTEEDLSALIHFPYLRHLDAKGCRNYSLLQKIQQTYPNIWVEYTVQIAGTEYPADTTALALTGASVRELLEKLPHLPLLESVSVQDPVSDTITMPYLESLYSDLDFSWETIIGNRTITHQQTELDLSGAELPSLAQLEQILENYPKLETLFLGECDIDNDDLATFREMHRNDFKVAWTVQVGRLMVRTDDTTFMPTKFGFALTEEQSYNLRYCEDMICVDVGHKDIESCSWAAYMPHLRYLIIADTRVSDLTPLTDLKELVYLELFNTCVWDYSPLLTCTGLEDLNISYTSGDYNIIYQMTWLKRLWWAGTYLSSIRAQEKLPDTELMFYRISSTGNGWREGQHYYDMRELLGMEIMFG